MFAFIAAVIFFLAAVGMKLGSINMLYLGLTALAIHFGFAWTPWVGWRKRRGGQ